MLEALRSASEKVVGIKQVLKEAEDGRIDVMLIAEDADTDVKQKLLKAASRSGTRVERVLGKRELGEAAGIQVPSACAAILKKKSV